MFSETCVCKLANNSKKSGKLSEWFCTSAEEDRLAARRTWGETNNAYKIFVGKS